MTEKKTLNVIGLMSGTSFDGVDTVLCKINPDLSYDVLACEVFNYPFKIREEIERLIFGNATIKDVCCMNFVLGNFYADCVLNLCEKYGVEISSIDLISSHGQTIYHSPKDEKIDDYSTKSTLQIGELSCIAKKTGVLTVGDFRPCDVALDGQGAPLVPFFDKIVFSKLDKNVAIQNLGGIANVTVIGKNEEFLAFDNAPANVLIDLAMQKYYGTSFDKDGEIGLASKYDKELLEYIYSIDSFVTSLPPKSTGKEYYNKSFLEKIISHKNLSPEVLIATLSAYTGFAVSYSLKEFAPCEIEEIVLSGGGAKNKAIIKYIKEFSGKKVSTSIDYGISEDFKEAIAFAILGYQRYYGLTNNEKIATGAKTYTSMGKIVLP